MIEGRRKGEAHAARDRTIGRVMLVLLALGVGVVVHSFIRLEIQHLKQRGRRSAAAFNRTSGQWSVGRRPGAGGLSGNVDGGNDNWAGAGEVTSGGAVGSNTGKNPVVLALSQGRSGSTITGNLLLKSHTYCGMFVDEPIWLVYRQLLAREYDTDQSVAIDLFFNTSQCNLQEELWGDDEMVSDWFYKRETHSEGDNTTLTQGFFTRENQTKLCKSLSRHNPPKAVCSKELRFLGFVKPLMKAASERAIPLTLLYQLRDPRATVFSQIWVFHRGDHTVDIGVYSIRKLRSACKVAVADLEAMQDKPPGVQVVQLCFEDLIHKPRSTLKSLYASIPGFAGWPLSDPHTLLPPETKLYGETHIKDWFEEKEVNLAGGKGGDWGGTKRSYDRYSSGKERSDHVNVWKEAWPFIKYDGMRKVWEEDPSCVRLRDLSQCAHLWPHLPLNQTQRNEMFASWGKVSIRELDDPKSWISKAMQQKIKKAVAMVHQAEELDAKGGVDEEALKAQYARWMGAKAKAKADNGQPLATAGGSEGDDGVMLEDGHDGHTAHWHLIHDANPGDEGKRGHPNSFRNVVTTGGSDDETPKHQHHGKADQATPHKGHPGGHKGSKLESVDGQKEEPEGEGGVDEDRRKAYVEKGVSHRKDNGGGEDEEAGEPPRAHKMGRGKNAPSTRGKKSVVASKEKGGGHKQRDNDEGDGEEEEKEEEEEGNPEDDGHNPDHARGHDGRSDGDDRDKRGGGRPPNPKSKDERGGR